MIKVEKTDMKDYPFNVQVWSSILRPTGERTWYYTGNGKYCRNSSEIAKLAEEYNAINPMCIDCIKFGQGCGSSYCWTWTGCIYRETDPRKALKRTLAELEALEADADKADAAYEADPENAEKEAAFDAAYKAEWSKAEEVAKLIVKMTSGQIDEKTARAMVNGKREEIEKMLA